MRFLPFLVFYLLCNVVGVYSNPPDVILWIMLLTLFVLLFWAVPESGLLPSWYIAVIYRIRKLVLSITLKNIISVFRIVPGE